MKILGVIPARYASTRFPGKPLVNIAGKSMIQRVYERTSLCKALDEVLVATDDTRIHDHVLQFGGHSVMTSSLHNTGTERIGEVKQILDARGASFDVYVNIQGDEPFIDPEDIRLVASCLTDPAIGISTLIKLVTDYETLFNPNVVKVLPGIDGRAICFSRQAIPFMRGIDMKDWVKMHSYFSHVGIYAYRETTLQALVQLPPSPAEKAESLEQMRWIEHGFPVYTKVTQSESVAIDTPEDLLKLTNIV